MKVSADCFALVGGEFGAVAPDPTIDQAVDTMAAVETTPVHEAGAAAAGTFGDLSDGIA